MALREYSGTAQATTLSGGISASALSIALADATGWPTGATGPFVVTINAGASSEEKVLCTSRAGNTLTVSDRGWDGTTASDHDNAESAQHTFSATDAREANAHVNAASAAHAASAITFTPVGGIAATDVQAAIAEVETEAMSKSALQSATVTATETTTSTSFAALATPGPAATVTVGPSGRVKVSVSARLGTDAAAQAALMSFAISGATTAAASEGRALLHRSATANADMQATFERVVDGLAAGSTTFTAQYRVTGGTGSFTHRSITVTPL